MTADELRRQCEKILAVPIGGRLAGISVADIRFLAEHTLRLLAVEEAARHAAWEAEAGEITDSSLALLLEALASFRAGHDTAERTQR